MDLPRTRTSPSSAIRTVTPGSGWPTEPIFCRSGRFTDTRRGRLGQPVPLEDGDADPAEEVPEPRRERRAAGDRPLGLAAERGAELAVDEPVEHRVRARSPNPIPPGPSSASLYATAVLAARAKILPLPSPAASASAPLYTFSNTRGTASTNVGWNDERSGSRSFMSGQCPSTMPRFQRADLDDPGEDVRERQEQQGGRGAGGVDRGERPQERVPDGGEQVLVRELAPLGPPGGPRGVDDRGDVLRAARPGPGVERLRGRRRRRRRSAPAGRSRAATGARAPAAGPAASAISAANPSVSAMTARACELPRIHSACSAEDVS